MRDAETPARSHDGRAFFILALLMFCLGGAVYSLVVLGEDIRFPDGRDYLDLARHLAALEGFSYDGVTPTAGRPPGYPFALAPLIALVDSVHAVRIGQFALLGLSAWWLGTLVNAQTGISRWHGASLVLLGVLCYPVLVYTAGTVFPQTLLMAALAAMIVQLVHPSTTLWRAALVGALAALICQISPTALVALPAAFAFALLSPRWSYSQIIIMGLSATLMLGGWVLRNTLVLGKPVVFSENLALNIDNAVLTLEPLEPDEVRPPDSTLGYGLDRLAQYAADPGIYLELLIDFFHYENKMTVREESTPVRDRIMFVTYYALLLLVMVRVLMMRRAPLSSAEWLVLGLYLATALFHSLVIPRIRYRLPFDFLLLLPAANALLIGWRSASISPQKLPGK